jgi:hypothetical protein
MERITLQPHTAESQEAASMVVLVDAEPKKKCKEETMAPIAIAGTRRKKMLDVVGDDFEELDETTHDDDDSVGDDDSTAQTGPPTPFGSQRAFSERSISNTSLNSNKSVRWSTIEVHSHELVLGDHPSAVEDGGPPLSIGWNSVSSIELSIDDFESERGPERRREGDLIVPAEVRHRRLLEQGFSQSEIKDRLNELTAIQKSRRKSSGQSSRRSPWDTIRRHLAVIRMSPKIIEVRSFAE